MKTVRTRHYRLVGTMYGTYITTRLLRGLDKASLVQEPMFLGQRT